MSTSNSYPLTPTSHNTHPRSRGLPHIKLSVNKNIQNGVKEVKGILANYQEFVNRGNVVDLAVGVVIGAAFSSIVNSMVNDLLAPVIGLAAGSQLTEEFVVIRAAPDGQKDFTTRDLAKAAGSVTLDYGNFLQQVINFFLISLFVYIFVRLINVMTFRNESEKAKKDMVCQYCQKKIPVLAIRCSFCTTWLNRETQSKSKHYYPEVSLEEADPVAEA
ncbi:3405_t:CDS:2 [Paraglomus brasilianum]|uniref:3405_t:CDS:1 n=1 Tax=Paraglomus brasilianum TaxID=144538 RepID=A0A9N8WHD8_9GLOM|nr:3405_t:CDS:2 [Paraglomus brasilianum]